MKVLEEGYVIPFTKPPPAYEGPNTCVKEQKGTLSHLQRALEITRKLDFQVTYDLKAAYHPIKIHESQTTYLV